jgi:hypothetical protein
MFAIPKPPPVQRPQVLRFGARRHSPHQLHQVGRRGGGQPHPRQDREEQAGCPVQTVRIRHHVRRRRLQAVLAPGSGRGAEIVTKSGSWFSYGTERIGQGRDSALEYIRQNPTTAADIENKIREALRGDDFAGIPTLRGGFERGRRRLIQESFESGSPMLGFRLDFGLGKHSTSVANWAFLEI